MAKKLLQYRTFGFLFGLLLILLVADSISFFFTCRNYSLLTPIPNSSIPKEVIEKEAIVVLTGDRKRIPMAIELLRLRGSPLLIISGTGKGATLTELINSQSRSAGNAQEIWKKIIIESQSTSTIENAVETGKILKRQGTNRVILITSEYHLPRSLAVFRSVVPGPEYFAYPVASEFTGMLQLEWVAFPEGAWKFFLEYWKYFLFRNYYLKQIEPNPKIL